MNFAELKFGKAEKRQRLLDLLQKLEVVKVVEKGRPSLRKPTTWTLGAVGAKAVGIAEKEVVEGEYIKYI